MGFRFVDIFEVIPGWIYAAALAAVLLLGGAALAWQTYRLSEAETQIAELERDAEKLRADRELTARQYAEKARLDERAHSLRQQEIVDAYQKKLRAAEVRRADDVARAERVSRDAAAAAASDRAAAKDDPAACQRVADRNQILYGLADEGFGLVVEGRSLLATRDAAVDALMGLITNDRAAICGQEKVP